eukprot:COSAG02_NODE_137_length_34526_cov_94.448079_21_plen_69_part_00
MLQCHHEEGSTYSVVYLYNRATPSHKMRSYLVDDDAEFAPHSMAIPVWELARGRRLLASCHERVGRYN